MTLVNRSPRARPELDQDVVAELLYHLRGIGVGVRLGRAVASVTRPPTAAR